MRKLLVILSIILLGTVCHAEDTVLQAGVTFDWLTITQEQRDQAVEYFKSIVFDENEIKLDKKGFRTKYADFLKDENYRENYILASQGIKETPKYNLSAFQTRGGMLIIYAIQYKDNLQNTYYYDALGNLKYVDETSENYPEFPYTTKQYRANGSMVAAYYVESKDVQYIYQPDGDFRGIWYKDKMFNQKAKQILTRTNW